MKSGEGDPWKKERRGGEGRSTLSRTHTHASTQRERQRISRGRAVHKEQSADYSKRCKPEKKKKEMEARICSVAEVRGEEEDLMTMNDDEEEEEKESYEQGES